MFDSDSPTLSTSAHLEITTLSLNVTSLVPASNGSAGGDGWPIEEEMELEGGATYVIDENVRVSTGEIWNFRDC